MEVIESQLTQLASTTTRDYLDAVPPISRTGFVYTDRFLSHNDALNHPESPARLESVIRQLETTGTIPQLVPIEASIATSDELLRVHTRRYLDALAGSEGKQLDPDTFCGESTPEIARFAAGGVLAATRAVISGAVANAFCAIRPPGHHALADHAMGFCFLNNVAVAAADVIASNPDNRVLIVDWDVHHGNGTQAIFYESATALYASCHQYPFYPGTGAEHERGRGEGRGFTINNPLAAGCGDEEFLSAISTMLKDCSKLMRPSITIISAGFDAHRDDPLGGLNVTTEGFRLATRLVAEFAQSHCGGKIVSVLEGGYNIRALADCVSVHLEELIRAGNIT